MIENTANTNIENENEGAKTAIYSSKFLMSKDLYYDFGSVVFNRTKKIFLVFFCLVAYLIGINLLVGNHDIVVGFGPFISFLMLLTYFRTKKLIKISYEQNLISAGKECTLNYELFEDKMVSHIDELKREYFYHQITKYFET